EDAARVRSAFAARDEALAALPHYARWLGRRSQLDDNRRQREDGDALVRLEELAKKAHALTDVLEKGPGASLTPLELANAGGVLRRGLQELEAALREYGRLVEQPDSPILWRNLDDMLAVPGDDVIARKAILARKARVGRQLFHGTPVAADKALATGKAGDKGLTPENAAKTVRKSAEVQGRLALAVLGQRWFDEVRG